MFPHHQMAVPMMPQAHPQAIFCFAAYSGGCGFSGCYVCTGTCYDTIGRGGGGCLCSHFSPVETAQVEDPAQALEGLRKSLELTLAGVQAQERLLNERKSSAEKK
ncbi:MAG: hypothetical protein WCF81_09235 [Roseiarcus sp.]